MNDTANRAIIAGGFVASVFVLHIREIPAEAELTAAGLLVAAAVGGALVGYTHANEKNQKLAELGDTVARIREDQKRSAKRFEIVESSDIEDDSET
jgi:hypothetical protein